MSETSSQPAGRVWYVSVVLLIAVALAMRVWRLDSVPGLNGDEAWYGVEALLFLEPNAGDGDTFSWRTPTGNAINLFFLLPQVLTHLCFEPGVATLRLTAVASGVLALGVNYWLCRRVFDRATATISTLLLAVAPQAIAYSRFAWDTSQSILAAVIAVYVSLLAARAERHRALWFVGTFVSLLFAVVIHPTSLFLVPVALLPSVSRWWYAGGRDRAGAYATKIGAARLAVVGATLLLTGLAVVAIQFPAVAERIARPNLAVLFAHRVSRLFSGVTVYQFIAGTRVGASEGPVSLAADVEPYDVAFWATIEVVAWAGWRYVSWKRRGELTALVVGMLLSLAAFYVVAGPNAIAPHFDRYGMWMIAPTVIIASRVVTLVIQRGGNVSLFGRAAVLTVSASLLCGFLMNYMAPFALNGAATAHRAFRTDTVEPKETALELIRQANDGPVRVVTTEWWTYWPLRYLAWPDRNIEVAEARRVGPELFILAAHKRSVPAVPGRVAVSDSVTGHECFVEFDGSVGDEALRRYVDEHEGSYRRAVVPLSNGKPLLVVYIPRHSHTAAASETSNDEGRDQAVESAYGVRDVTGGANEHGE